VGTLKFPEKLGLFSAVNTPDKWENVKIRTRLFLIRLVVGKLPIVANVKVGYEGSMVSADKYLICGNATINFEDSNYGIHLTPK
jgi:hypothetical protein